jgi:hypothetical protein
VCIRHSLIAHHKQAKALIDAGADVNLANRDGTTALMKGVQNGRWECSCLLARSKADMATGDRVGKTAPGWAEKQGDELFRGSCCAFLTSNSPHPVIGSGEYGHNIIGHLISAKAAKAGGNQTAISRPPQTATPMIR